MSDELVRKMLDAYWYRKTESFEGRVAAALEVAYAHFKQEKAEAVAAAVAAEREKNTKQAENRSPVPADARQKYIALEATEKFDSFLVCIECGAVVSDLSTQVHSQFHAKVEGRKL